MHHSRINAPCRRSRVSTRLSAMCVSMMDKIANHTQMHSFRMGFMILNWVEQTSTLFRRVLERNERATSHHEPSGKPGVVSSDLFHHRRPP